MNNHLIFWPLLAQMLIPVLVLMLNGKRKAADVKSGKFDREKAAIDNEAWSLPVILTSKSLANQFQLPVLFYVLCLVLAQLNAVDTFALIIAWLFVVTRYVHAYVHVSSNYVPMRLRAFLLGALFLLCLIVNTTLALLKA
ncbi:MAG: MAPEG family protein [Gammaproteobacteria bacterium]|nr:MAPEG family protein [Gammaproteobacteria bacterium]